MNASDYWHLFLDTGAPEFYVCFVNQKKREEGNVSDGSGSSTASG